MHQDAGERLVVLWRVYFCPDNKPLIWSTRFVKPGERVCALRLTVTTGVGRPLRGQFSIRHPAILLSAGKVKLEVLDL